MNLKIFYCWQSDLPNKINRYLIRDSIKHAIKKAKREDGLSLEIDHDTRDKVGSPGITDSIHEKIRGSAVFVADLSIVGTIDGGKSTPNPNVMCEYGFAIATVGEDAVVGVFNRSSGDLSQLPFDVNQHAIRCQYDLSHDASTEEQKRKTTELGDNLYKNIMQVLNSAVFKDVSNDAKKLVQKLCQDSEHGRYENLQAQNLVDDFGWTIEQVESAVDELQHNRWVTRKGASTGGDFLICTNDLLFWDFDRLFSNGNPPEDAFEIIRQFSRELQASHATVQYSQIVERLGWDVRRLNPAVTYLVEKRLVKGSGVKSHPEVCPLVISNSTTRAKEAL